MFHLGMDAAGFRSLHDGADKFAVPIGTPFSEQPVPLSVIFELVRVPEGEEVAAKAVEGLEKFPVISNHTYRNFLISPLKLQQWHFSEVARICGAVRVYRLHRPGGRYTAEELAELLLQIVRKGG